MPTEYFEIDIVWDEESTVKELYNNEEKDLLKPWYMALSDIYGMKTNNFDGYVHRAFINGSNAIKLVCYLVDDHAKTSRLKTGVLGSWKAIQAERIEEAIKAHIQRLNTNVPSNLIVRALQ